MKREKPDHLIAVVIPELVQTHWYEYLLHNQRAALLKLKLFLQAGERVIVVNTPWCLREDLKDKNTMKPEDLLS